MKGRWLGTALAFGVCLRCVAAEQTAPPTPPPAPAAEGSTAPHPPISPQQAATLFRSVDVILQFDAHDTGLPIHHTVQRRLISREEVLSYLRKQMEDDKGTARLQRSALVLEKFGLLPPGFDLGGFLLRLLGEQVAGYYDAKTKTVNLLNWVDADEQKPVLAHELCHALQDQFVSAHGSGLDKWENVGPDDPSKNYAQDLEHIRYDETDTARDAVLEGQAMVTYVDWGLNGQGQTLRTLPMIGTGQMSAVTANDPSSPVLNSAPLVLRESLLFPYQAGLTFEQTLLKARGTMGAFTEVLTRPPNSSWEIMNPEAYEAGQRAPVLRMPDLHGLLDRDWEPYDIGVMGELDVQMLGEALADVGAGADAAKNWDGGVYYAAQRRGSGTGVGTGSVALVYLSRWKTDAAASAFASLYRRSLAQRYPGALQTSATLQRTVTETSEGPVLVEQRDRTLFVSHTFPLALAEAVETQMLAAQVNDGAAPPASAELSAPLRRFLAGTGVLRPAAILTGTIVRSH